jgi:hypothetical protein
LPLPSQQHSTLRSPARSYANSDEDRLMSPGEPNF